MSADGRIFSDAIFDAGFDFAGPHLVEASAGTGKTHNIQNICARLVAEKDFRVPEIQVMTFTDAATKELRDRIRRVLIGFRTCLTDGLESIADEAERERFARLRACALANATEADAKARLTRALVEFDRAAISTIHGFCRKALARYAFETDSPFAAELGDGGAAGVERAARDWWRTHRAAAPAGAADGFGFFLRCATLFAGRPDGAVADGADAARHWLMVGAREAADAYLAARAGRREMTFDDLLLALRDALRDGARGAALAAYLRDAFKAVVVDEFQDTDPVQYEIFRRAFLTDAAGTPVFFVGDPKQAIYSFRGGDIHTYTAAAARPDIAGNRFRLDVNYRSTPRLMDAVNALFADGPDGSVFGDAAISYPEPIRATTRPALPEHGRDDPSPFRILDVASAAESLDAVVTTTLDLLARPEGDVSPRDIAILVPSHARAKEIGDHLRAHGVPAVLQRAGNVFATPVAAEFRTVLQALAGDGGAERARAALATRFFDVTDAELAQEDDGGLTADFLGWFAAWGETWLKRGFHAAFRALEAHPRCRLRARLAAAPDGERALADIFQIADLAVKAVRDIGPAPAALVDWLTDRLNRADDKDAEQDADEYARELESEADAVKIMTMYVSKGLQFPVVILPLPSSDGFRLGPFPYHDAAAGDRLTFTDAANDAVRREQADERMRLLYVALTRATKRTVVIHPTKGRSGWPYARLFDRPLPPPADGVSPILRTVYTPPPEPRPAYVPPRPAAETLRDVPDGMRSFVRARPCKGSYSSLAPHTDGTAGDRDADAAEGRPPAPDAAPDHPIFALPGGPETGLCWHEILETVPFDATDARLAEHVRRALRAHGMEEAGVPVVADMIGRTLRREIVAPCGDRFRLADIPAADRLSEWEFQFASSGAAVSTDALKAVIERHWRADDPDKKPFLDTLRGWSRPLPDGFVRGFVDLVFRRNGRFYIVDWKSNVLGGTAASFDRAGVRTEMADAGYFFQYLLYSAVLHRFLKETLGADYSWERCFGGVLYVFLRGVAAGADGAVFTDRPAEALLDDLEAALGLEGA